MKIIEEEYYKTHGFLVKAVSESFFLNEEEVFWGEITLSEHKTLQINIGDEIICHVNNTTKPLIDEKNLIENFELSTFARHDNPKGVDVFKDLVYIEDVLTHEKITINTALLTGCNKNESFFKMTENVKSESNSLSEGQNITRTNLKEIFYALSLAWQTKLFKEISNLSVFDENIFIPKKIIEDLVKDSNEEQIKIIKKFLIIPEDLPKVITDSINSFDNACTFLGKNRIELLGHFTNIPLTPSIRRQIELAKLEVIVEALNGGWAMPNIKNGDEPKNKYVVTFDHLNKKHKVNERVYSFPIPASLVLKEKYLAEHLIKIIEKENINFFSEL